MACCLPSQAYATHWKIGSRVGDHLRIPSVMCFVVFLLVDLRSFEHDCRLFEFCFEFYWGLLGTNFQQECFRRFGPSPHDHMLIFKP